MYRTSFTAGLFVAVVFLLNCRQTRGECSVDQFQCATSGICIHLSAVCDRSSNCPDGSDEQNCTFGCTEEEFKCSDDTCVNMNVVCNGNLDCEDGLDEQHCIMCGPEEFECDIGECISEEAFCDDNVDCSNSKDEPNSCNLGLLIGLSVFFGIILWIIILTCLCIIAERVSKCKKARVARLRAPTNARGSVVQIDDPEAPSQTPETNTTSSTQPADSSETQNHIEETVFTDAQFSSGVAPPSYVTASDYETIQGQPNQGANDQETVIPVDELSSPEQDSDAPPPYTT